MSTNLTSALVSATSGLRVTQRSLDVIGRNVANAGVVGYTRKILDQTTVIAGGRASGVDTLPLRRDIDLSLQAELRRSISREAGFAFRETYLDRLQVSFGKPDDAASFIADYNDLRAAFDRLETAPNEPGYRQEVLRRAQDLAFNLNRTSDDIQTLRRDAQTAIGEAVDRINDRLRQLDDLNQDIFEQRQRVGSAPDLEDRRDVLLDELAEDVPITYFINSDGRVDVSLVGGAKLLDAEPSEFSPSFLEFSVSPVTPDSSVGDGLDGVELDGRDVTAALTSTRAGGRLSAALHLRDEILPQAQAQLDEFAIVIADAFRDNDLTLFTRGTNDVPAYPPGSPAEEADIVGFAGEIQVNEFLLANQDGLQQGIAFDGTLGPAVDPGDASLIQTLRQNVFEANFAFRATGGPTGTTLATGTTPIGLPTETTLARYGSRMLGFQAQQIESLRNDLDFETTLLNEYETRLTARSGVNLDQEMAQMLVLQNTYAANARTITTVQRMFDDLVNIIR